MSLISDPEYIIHNLRLNYLRHVDDPYGPRIISISPRHCVNPLVAATGLDDPQIWPEINVPSSPRLVEVDLSPVNGYGHNVSTGLSMASDGPSFGATGLKHTDTIYGPSRSGLVGMRVSGRREAGSVKPRGSGAETPKSVTSLTPVYTPRFRSDSAPTPVTPSTITASNIHITSASPEKHQVFPPPGTPRRRGSAGTAVNRSSDRPALPPPAYALPTQSNKTQPATIEPAPAAPGFVPPGGSFHLPIFARAAEMEARRRERMRARNPQLTPVPPPEPSPKVAVRVEPSVSPKLNFTEVDPSISAEAADSPPGSEDEEGAEAEYEDDEEDDDEEDRSMPEVGRLQGEKTPASQQDDEFDPPDLLNANYGSRPVVTSVPSDDISLLSQPSLQSALSTSHSSTFGPPSAHLQVTNNVSSRSKLSPVTESRLDEHTAVRDREVEENVLGKTGTPPAESYFDIVRPSGQASSLPSLSILERSSSPVGTAGKRDDVEQAVSLVDHGPDERVNVRPPAEASESQRVGHSAHHLSLSSTKIPPAVFAKRPVPPRPDAEKSALTAQLESQFMPSDNPFTDLYAAISGRAEPASLSLSLYFPYSFANRARPLDVKVRKDATVEEVIGFGLWAYWDREWVPRLDEGLAPAGKSIAADREREKRLSTIGWCLRMVEEDGEPDEDFPALERSRPIAKFAFNAYAVCEATEAQISLNETDNAAIVRRPSRLTTTKRQNTTGTLSAPDARAGTSVITSSGITALANAAGASGLVIPPVFLRVRMAAPDAPHFSTTIHTTNDTYLADVLEAVCRKRRLTSSKEWGLMTSDMTIAIPLDRTVASLQGRFNLVLVSRAYLEENGLTAGRWKTTDPNASIYQNIKSDGNDPKGAEGMDFTAGYKKFTVHRKMPVLGRHERTLAIDGHYIHLLPHNTARAFPSSTKTSSHHVTAVVSCKQSRKIPSTVKLTVIKDNAEKRYELEAENAKEAAEIVSIIKGLQKSYQLERPGAYPRGAKPRRARAEE